MPHYPQYNGHAEPYCDVRRLAALAMFAFVCVCARVRVCAYVRGWGARVPTI